MTSNFDRTVHGLESTNNQHTAWLAKGMDEPPAVITAHVALMIGYLVATHPGVVGKCVTTVAGERGWCGQCHAQRAMCGEWSTPLAAPDEPVMAWHKKVLPNNCLLERQGTTSRVSNS